jgi:hypothetical protein
MTTTFEVDLPPDLEDFRLPVALADRLQTLLDKQDAGQELTVSEQAEAQGLVDLAEFMSLLKLRARRISA